MKSATHNNRVQDEVVWQGVGGGGGGWPTENPSILLMMSGGVHYLTLNDPDEFHEPPKDRRYRKLDIFRNNNIRELQWRLTIGLDRINYENDEIKYFTWIPLCWEFTQGLQYKTRKERVSFIFKGPTLLKNLKLFFKWGRHTLQKSLRYLKHLFSPQSLRCWHGWTGAHFRWAG